MKKQEFLPFIGINVAIFGIFSFPAVSQMEDLNFRKQINQTQNIPLEIQRDIAIERAIRREFADFGEAEYYYNRVDLNGDGQPEAIVYFRSTQYCGSGGCSHLIFQKTGEEYRLVSNIFLSANLIVTNQKSNGWSDLIISPGHITLQDLHYLIKFNGKTYPSDPTEGILIGRKAKMIGKSYFNDLLSNPGFVLKP